MEKIKVLVVMNDMTAIGHYRCGWPGGFIRDNLNDEIEIEITALESIIVWDMLKLKQYDVIHFNGAFGYFESVDELYPMIQSHGVKLVMDIDDYWEMPEEFPYNKHVSDKYVEGLLNSVRKADYITTTTDAFKEKLMDINKNVAVLPNAVDMSHRMWQSVDEPSDVVRIGWLGSSQRHGDLMRLKDSIDKLYSDKELKGKFTLALFGGDKENKKLFEGDGFVNYPWVEAFSFGHYYSKMDICLAPLKENIYNQCRSEIKMVESGMNNKAFICQDYGIYSGHIEHGKTGLLVKDDNDWYTHIKMLILDKDLRLKLGRNLNKYVNPKFAIETIAKQRVEFYKSICNEELV